MDPETRVVHGLLEAWGKTCGDRFKPWPSRTLLGKIIDYGARGAAQASHAVDTIPDEVANVDAAVSRLGQIDKKVIVAYYTRYDPPEIVARKLHMRYRMFQAVLRRARWRIGGYISALD
jgi:hypothetical protein